MNNSAFQNLLDNTVAAKSKHTRLQAQCHAEIRARYGVDYNESDCDRIIDALDYGNGRLTVGQIEEDVKFAKEHGHAQDSDERY